MEKMKSKIEELKLRDIQIVLELFKTQSVRELARQRKLTPGAISKIVKNAEKKLNIQLLDRSSYGVEPTTEALRVLPLLNSIHDQQIKLESELTQDHKKDVMTFASSSFLTTHLIPKFMPDLEKLMSGSHLRLLDMTQDQFVLAGLRGVFEFCLHTSDIDWPKSWTTVKIGQLNYDLYCRKDHSISSKPSLKQVLEQTFVCPIYWSPEGVRSGTDNCPVSLKKRKIGHETATASSALEIMKQTNDLAFLPTIVCDIQEELGLIRKVHVSEWKKVSLPIYLTVKSDRVKQMTLLKIKSLLQKNL